MVQCFVTLEETSNRVVNIVKAKYGLRDKSEAINALISDYAESVLEPELRPEFVASVEKARKGPFKKVADFGKEYGVRT
ncbi:MAG: DUF2683 family protein [Candidatus Micrarchaeia archaeon]|jgi:hypothetical protein